MSPRPAKWRCRDNFHCEERDWADCRAVDSIGSGRLPHRTAARDVGWRGYARGVLPRHGARLSDEGGNGSIGALLVAAAASSVLRGTIQAGATVASGAPQGFCEFRPIKHITNGRVWRRCPVPIQSTPILRRRTLQRRCPSRGWVWRTAIFRAADRTYRADFVLARASILQSNARKACG